MKNILKSAVVLTAVLAAVSYSTLAAFTAKATVKNSTFSTGNAALRFMKDLAGSPTGENLTDELTGPTFSNILPNWTGDFPLKLVNAGSVNLVASALGVYVSDTSDLRNQIYVQAFAWTDDGDGIAQPGEIGAAYAAPMTLEQWRSNAITFGQINVSGVMPMVLRFSTGDLSDAYQGQTTVFDFQFNGTTTGATQ